MKKILVAAVVLYGLLPIVALAGVSKTQVGVNKNMEAQLMTPDGDGPYPAVLVLHTSGGLQSGDLEFARRMVQQGYVALVPSFLNAYGITANTRQRTFTTSAMSIYEDLVASLDVLRHNAKVDGKRIAAVGFSNGGYFALWLAATGKVQAGVCYYGAVTGAGTDKVLSRFREAFTSASSPVLILHGTGDSTVPFMKAVELEEILTGAKSRHEFHEYPGAGHRFDRDGGSANESAFADAWPRTLSFLREFLKE